MNATDPIAGELLPLETSTPVVEYSATAAAIADLRARYTGARYDCATSAGMAAALAARRELRGLRTSLESRRKELKAPVIERGRVLDAEAKRITSALAELEDPIDEQIRVEEARKDAEREARAAAERERVAAIARRVDWIRDAFVRSVESGAGPDELAATVADLEALPITPDLYAERINEAEEARTATVLRLRELASRAREQAAREAAVEAERAELERLRKEAEARRAREDEERRQQIAREDEERAAARKIEDERIAAERAEQERKDAADRAEREAAERAERDAREQQAREAELVERLHRENARRELETIEREADPWSTLTAIVSEIDGTGSGDAWELVRVVRGLAEQTLAARARLRAMRGEQ